VTSEPGLEELLTNLEATIAQLAEGTAPLEELVSAHQRAIELLAKATARLAEVSASADAVARSLSE
jgi:exodeoxyribonuclease VII small subunit